jgi:hypothetical protein
MNDQSTRRSSCLQALALAFVVWLVFSWPLPLHVTSAIPSGSAKPAQHVELLPMQPGDHLQLDYHFWLFSDMLAGRTPWFYNLYEFNTGDDAERREPGSFYLPFSFFYTVGAWIAGRAFAWNLTGFLSLWLAVWFTFKLARRYTSHAAPAWLAAAAAIMLPYRWITLAGGSPTGLAMAWVPLLLLGLDTAVRDDRIRGGIAAGIAIVLAAWGDPHTFFFGILATPCWCIFAFMHREEYAWKDWRFYARIAVALAPVALFAGLAYLSSPTASRNIGEAGSAVRSVREILLFSPERNGFWSWTSQGVSDHVYIGYVVFVALLAGFAFLLRKPKQVFAWVFLVAGMALVCLLALGPNGPYDGAVFAAARKLIGPYGMIRQPAKVFCLMPSIMAVAIALSVSAMRTPRAAALFFGLLLAAEWRSQIQPLVNRYDTAQGAYEAVARETQRPARALAIPLWPGDSHFASVYQHYASLYRIRLVNGYRPFVANDYIETIFHGFESVNQGAVTDSQLDDLAGRGVDFLLVHEDLFPEKVSPFPVGFTLHNLMANPRLKLLKQSGPVWAFAIETAPVAKPDAAAWPFYFPTRRIEMEKGKLHEARPAPDKYACRGGYVELHHPGARVTCTPVQSAPAPDLRWLVRFRGQGTVRCTSIAGAESQTSDVNVQSLDWAWYDLKCPAMKGYEFVSVSFEYAGGPVDVDAAILTAGTWHPLQPGESFVLPAPAFFHAGHIDLAGNAVILSKDNVLRGSAFYGPKLPLESGEYEINLVTRSGTGEGTDVGTLTLSYVDAQEIQQAPVKAAVDTHMRFAIDKTLPFMAVFSYNGAAEMELGDVTIRRVR